MRIVEYKPTEVVAVACTRSIISGRGRELERESSPAMIFYDHLGDLRFAFGRSASLAWEIYSAGIICSVPQVGAYTQPWNLLAIV